MYEFADKVMKEPGQAMKAIIKKGMEQCTQESQHLSQQILDECKADYKQLIRQFMFNSRKELIQKYSSLYQACLESQDPNKNCNQILTDALPNSKILTERIKNIHFNTKPIVDFRHNIQNVFLDLRTITKTRVLILIQKYCKKLEANQVKKCEENINKKIQLYSKAQIAELHQSNNFLSSQCLINNQVSEECLERKLNQFKQHEKQFIRKIQAYDIQ